MWPFNMKIPLLKFCIIMVARDVPEAGLEPALCCQNRILNPFYRVFHAIS